MTSLAYLPLLRLSRSISFSCLFSRSFFERRERRRTLKPTSGIFRELPVLSFGNFRYSVSGTSGTKFRLLKNLLYSSHARTINACSFVLSRFTLSHVLLFVPASLFRCPQRCSDGRKLVDISRFDRTES